MTKLVAAAAAVLFTLGLGCGRAPAPDATTASDVDALAAAKIRRPLDAGAIPQFTRPLVVPPEMPRISAPDAAVDEYEIAVRQFKQEILPPTFPTTTVWGYGAVNAPDSFNYPSFTIEAKHGKKVRVKWINGLVDSTGKYLPHLLPVDQTLHWANPAQHCADGMPHTDCRGVNQNAYLGPVPMVVHVHGSHTTDVSDGAPEGWWLPDATNIPANYARWGTMFGSEAAVGRGAAVFEYANDQRATTLWYHDHTLGMTRLNVYAGPAGFFLIRGGPDDVVKVGATQEDATLPSGEFEVPLAIQDRSFYDDGSLFYPDSRKFFDGFTGPFAPGTDIAPIFNPETFGNTIVVNGRTWPFLDVKPQRYRLRFLNGSQARFLLLEGRTGPAFDPTDPATLEFWQLGAEGGFLPAPVKLTRLLMAPAERADVIVDFSAFAGKTVRLVNLGPDEPFGGGLPRLDGENGDFDPANPATTGKVMEFRVAEGTATDPTTSPAELKLPDLAALPEATNTRRLSLNESDSSKVCLTAAGKFVACSSAVAAEPFGPEAARLGVVDGAGSPQPMAWMDEVTETPAVGSIEVWELYNFTADAHPIHIHLVQFEVVNREKLVVDEDGMSVSPLQLTAEKRGPEEWETGRKDTVIVYPGEVTRVKAHFDKAGRYVWHCHIVEHEDNEMMRPFVVQ